jgi:hypothetical protein
LTDNILSSISGVAGSSLPPLSRSIHLCVWCVRACVQTKEKRLPGQDEGTDAETPTETEIEIEAGTER